MNKYNVYFDGVEKPLVVISTSFGDAEKNALHLEKFRSITRIEKVNE